ncbi:GntR family transcriptional regulator [Prauserella rugosa]|uniref:DNA-binding GntR family transcriptional regulator n=1 Tax=Prauserella rugosa TaxID=43354 RepID=A0A660CML9_9PSEU|nr:GntR family transcriptional regulator [Prauserella rugosa]KID31163.1 transcriptional regulator [Prauserella sp. Am3]TWH22939.1 DNA-binding GntR family transcriptional regulator [Prauserella rugosa]
MPKVGSRQSIRITGVTEEALRSLDRTTLRERALVAIRSAIVSGGYAPGDHLGEVEIASRLHISRGTVREALRHLQQEGLVTAGVRGMLRVRTLSQDEVYELFRVRGALEGLAAAELIQRGDISSAVSELNGLLDALAAEQGELADQFEADLAFHERLCELSGNSILLSTWRQLEGPMRIVVMSAGREQRRVSMSATQHRPIVEAVEKADVDAAVKVVQEHMEAAFALLTGEN